MTIASLFLAALLQDAVPTPEPTPEPARLVAAFESAQGSDTERIALFSDGTIVHSTVYRGRRVSSRRSISTNELEVLRRVASGTADLASEEFRSGVVGDRARVIRIEVAEPGGAPRHYLMDELSRIPLSLARLRGALLELQDRFYKEVGKEADWDPSGVTVGTVLRRRGDGRRFRVVRDDRFERNLELEQLEGGTLRVHHVRAELPKSFEEPKAEASR